MNAFEIPVTDEQLPESRYTQHTPRPRNISSNNRTVEAANGVIIAEVYNHASGYLFNRNLIAEAPSTLDALKQLYASFQHDGNGRTKGNQAKTDIIKYNDDIKIALTTARLAIEKAEAES